MIIVTSGDGFEEGMRLLAKANDLAKERVTDKQWELLYGGATHVLLTSNYVEELKGRQYPVLLEVPCVKQTIEDLLKVISTLVKRDVAKEIIDKFDDELGLQVEMLGHSGYISATAYSFENLEGETGRSYSLACMYEISEEAFDGSEAKDFLMTPELLSELPEDVQKIDWISK